MYMVTTLDLIPLDAFTLQVIVCDESSKNHSAFWMKTLFLISLAVCYMKFSTSKARAVVSVHKNDIEELTISHAILKVKTLFLVRKGP